MLDGKRSIHSLPPLETGGFQNRQGNDVQDHVAASFCIQMWGDVCLRAVWCETQDDITLIWQQESGGQEVEFVQVKSNELDQLWTVAKLCEADSESSTKEGTSIFERSLAYDRCEEPCRFRIVTCRPVKSDLQILTFALESEQRKAPCADIAQLFPEFEKRPVKNFVSKNGNRYDFWLSRTVWQIVHERDAVRDKNLRSLSHAVEAMGEMIAQDHLEELYEKIVRKVYDAALAHPLKERAAKKISREEFVAWLRSAVQGMVHPMVQGGGKAKKKMQAAGLPADVIKSALEEKTAYRFECLKPQYLKLEDRRLAEMEVRATLQSLKADLDAGEIDDSGPQFHARCLRALEQVRAGFPEDSKPTRSFMQGCMYGMADRCVHRFTKATS